MPVQVAGLVRLGPDLNHRSVTEMSPPPSHPPSGSQLRAADSEGRTACIPASSARDLQAQLRL